MRRVSRYLLEVLISANERQAVPEAQLRVARINRSNLHFGAAASM
jgi:hypothetical protein